MAYGYGFLDYEPAVAYFAQQVAELSGGSLRVDVVNLWGGEGVPDAEQRIVRDVASGKADLAWVGTRAFDSLGVDSFQALTAPMLIDSYPLQQALIQSDIPDRMLAGLAPLDVTGLAVLADGLRRPVAVQRPLLSPSDWRGITFAAFRSSGQGEAIRALGATPTDIWGLPLNQAFDDGAVQGREVSVLIYFEGGVYGSAPYVTANVTLWPQTGALLANPDRLAGPSHQQQGWLHQAAGEAAAHSTSLVDRDADSLQGACDEGARFADASEADLAALRQAFVPVYAHLEQDAETKAFIEEIQQLKQSTRGGSALVIPPQCTGPAPEVPVPETPDAEPGAVIPDGVYRATVTEESLLAAGIGPIDARDNSGIFTITMDGALATFGDTNTNDPTDTSCIADVTYSGARVSFYGGPNCGTASGKLLLSARWTFENGELRFLEIQPDDPLDRLLWGSVPWTKIA
jgi:TRAP-type C4-dicarboxylate transport system substrate-binding protein